MLLSIHNFKTNASVYTTSKMTKSYFPEKANFSTKYLVVCKVQPGKYPLLLSIILVDYFRTGNVVVVPILVAMIPTDIGNPFIPQIPEKKCSVPDLH